MQLIDEQLEGVDGGCAAMLVVGGFAASPYLMKRIKLAFSERVPLIWQPPQSGSAILEGAVLYGAPSMLQQWKCESVAGYRCRWLRQLALAGLQPDIIGTRCARKTYGVRIATPWTSCYDGSACEKFTHQTELVSYARDVFQTFITAGATRWLRVCALCDTPAACCWAGAQNS